MNLNWSGLNGSEPESDDPPHASVELLTGVLEDARQALETITASLRRNPTLAAPRQASSFEGAARGE